MAKFEVHKYNQNFMARIAIHSYDLTDPKNEFFTSFVTLFNVRVAVMLFIISSGAVVYQNWPRLDIILGPFLMVIAGIQYGGMFLTVGINMKKVKLLHLTLQQIVNEADEDTELNIYWTAEEKCRKYTKTLAYFIFVDQTMFYVALIFSIYNVCVGNLDTSTWLLPVALVVPFSTEHILGWYIVWCLEMCMAVSYSWCISVITAYFVSSCFYIGAICDHFVLLIDSLKGNIQSSNEEKNVNKLAPMKYKQIDKKLHSIVEIHVKLSDVFKMVADINSGSIFSLLLPNVIFVACTMYNLENADTEMLVMIAFQIVCVICSLAWPLLYCYFATFATYRVAAIAQAAFDSNWLDWPPKLQKYIILIIARSQEPIYFTGFGLFSCTLEVFGKLLKTSGWYYLIFRCFSQRQQL